MAADISGHSETSEDLNKKSPKVGPIIIARHGRPALDRRAGPRLGWREYKDWWARYEIGSLAEDQVPPEALKKIVEDCEVYLASSRPRAHETAMKAAPHAEIETSDLFWEANLPPPMWEKVRFLPKTWNIMARAAWLRGHKLDGEGKSDAELRADKAADYLIERAQEGKVFLAAHGWFNRMLRPRLKRRGWVCVRDGGDSYWSYRLYIPAE
ncbi:histidine phosphatase family protein [Ponticaulis sp.]|uniref:histidine phosphatase family protein n=1 Tax=Ponticaulis sp. TaxID=2020902 RepID=UPI0025FDE687|nr:histidine phosphatase family protein [Ponticaulis sp.]